MTKTDSKSDTKTDSRKIRYYTIDDAIKAPVQSKRPFIIANERKCSSSVGRYYTVFHSYKEFLVHRSEYPHCHEILVDHVNSPDNPGGRLVFDFDISLDCKSNSDKPDGVPSEFKLQVESTIYLVIEKYFTDVDTDQFVFVWSTSQNPKKFSKHLTVKNLYFDNWIAMSKIFYKLFSKLWDKNYDWIKSDKLIDSQIIRLRGSLRMVGSTKINGYPLVFDNDNHWLSDSLIRIYSDRIYNLEQKISISNLKSKFKSKFDTQSDGSNKFYINYDTASSENTIRIKNSTNLNTKPVHPESVYEKAFQMQKLVNKTIFTKGRIKGAILNLLREKSAPCLLTGKEHDSDNAYVIITDSGSNYTVRYGCHRNCYHKKTIRLGTIGKDKLDIRLDSVIKSMINRKKSENRNE